MRGGGAGWEDGQRKQTWEGIRQGFWALLIRGVSGQFHNVSYYHLQRYADEFCYRYNLRSTDPFEAFDFTIKRCLGVQE